MLECEEHEKIARLIDQKEKKKIISIEFYAFADRLLFKYGAEKLARCLHKCLCEIWLNEKKNKKAVIFYLNLEALKSLLL